MTYTPDFIRFLSLLCARVVRLAFLFLPLLGNLIARSPVVIPRYHDSVIPSRPHQSMVVVLCPLAPNLIWVTSSIGLDAIQVFCGVFCGIFCGVLTLTFPPTSLDRHCIFHCTFQCTFSPNLSPNLSPIFLVNFLVCSFRYSFRHFIRHFTRHFTRHFSRYFWGGFRVEFLIFRVENQLS